MNDEQKAAALNAAEDLAEEANGNGNDWGEWCEPRLLVIREALESALPTPERQEPAP